MKVKLKNTTINAAQVTKEPTEDFALLSKYFPLRSVGSRESVGGYWAKAPNGESVTAFWGQWFIWCESGVIATMTDEKFREIFEADQ